MTIDSDIRHGREFGRGTSLGDKYNEFFQKPIEQQVKEMGWSHACPVVDQVIKEYGAEWTLKRYAECNFVFGLIVKSAKDLNPELYIQLTTPVDRLPDEPVGIFTKFTPESHKTKMSPLSTPWGFALSREPIEQMGRGKNRTPKRMQKAFEIIDDVVKTSKTPIELTIRLSEEVSKMDADPKTVLSHLLSAGILKEENCVTMFKEMMAEMRKSAPTLTKIYDGMSSAEKQELDIVDF